MGKALHVRKNDTVEVMCGNHRGRRGRVLQAMPKKGEVIVEGVNYVWKHVRPNRQNPRGGRIQIEAAIDASNVLPLCQNRECEKYDHGVRTKAVVSEDGTKARGCGRCGHVIRRSEQ
jgi:large subunit ribosomal protein L24